MSEVEEVKRRHRRSSQEIGRLVAQFETSGLRASEFCRIHGITHGTRLQRLNLTDSQQRDAVTYEPGQIVECKRLTN
jgi:hypothetical protein